MDSGVMIVLSVICCVVGFFLNRTYATTDEISFRFLFWIIVTFLSYGAGLWQCRQHAKRQQAEPGDTVIAMAAQAILPVGAAVVILLATGMIAFGFLWAH